MAEKRGLQLAEVIRECHLFKRLTDEQVALLADEMSIKTVRKDHPVFEQDSPADAFYFILSGRVRTTIADDKEEFELGIYEEGDYIGLDALTLRGKHAISAKAKTDVTVGVLSHDQLRVLVKNNPLVDRSLDTIYRSYQLGLRQDFSWRGPRETIHYIARKHDVFLYLKLLLPMMVLIGSVVLWVNFFSVNPGGFMLFISGVTTAGGLGWLLWNWLDWSNDYAIITNRRVIYQERVILMYESQQETPLEAILSDDVITTFWGRWLGYGNVVVRTFTGTLILPRLANPREIKMILAERRARATVRGRQTRYETMRKVIRLRFGGDVNAQMPEDEKLLSPKVKMGPLQTALNDLLLMRWEIGDAIIYRTHWLILFYKTSIPGGVSLLMMALIIWGAISQNFLASPLFLGLLFLVLVFASGWWIYSYLDWRNDQYIVTPKELVDVTKKPLGKEERRSAPLENIQNINHERKNLIALIFNYGTVYIRVGDEMLSFDDVPNPASVQREIFDRFWERKQAKERKAADEEQERMIEWLEVYHEYQEGTDGEGEQAG